MSVCILWLNLLVYLRTEECTVLRVAYVGRNAAHQVRRVDVLEIGRPALLCAKPSWSDSVAMWHCQKTDESRITPPHPGENLYGS